MKATRLSKSEDSSSTLHGVERGGGGRRLESRRSHRQFRWKTRSREGGCPRRRTGVNAERRWWAELGCFVLGVRRQVSSSILAIDGCTAYLACIRLHRRMGVRSWTLWRIVIVMVVASRVRRIWYVCTYLAWKGGKAEVQSFERS